MIGWIACSEGDEVLTGMRDNESRGARSNTFHSKFRTPNRNPTRIMKPLSRKTFVNVATVAAGTFALPRFNIA